MKTPDTTIRRIRIACWLAGGVVLGVVAGEISDVMGRSSGRPSMAAEIMVAAGDKEGDEGSLSTTHAAIVLRNFFIKKLPEEIRDQPEKLTEHVRIRAEKNGTRITVDVPELDENRGIARGIARIFRGIPLEKELAVNPVEIPAFTETDRNLAIDAGKLKGLLHDQATKAGYIDFLQILPKAVNGSAKAKAVVEDEDFSRRFRRYEEISVAMGLEGVPGKALTSAPDVIFDARLADEAREPTKRSSKANLVSGACMLLAVAGAWLTGRKEANGPEVGSADSIRGAES